MTFEELVEQKVMEKVAATKTVAIGAGANFLDDVKNVGERVGNSLVTNKKKVAKSAEERAAQLDRIGQMHGFRVGRTIQDIADMKGLRETGYNASWMADRTKELLKDYPKGASHFESAVNAKARAALLRSMPSK